MPETTPAYDFRGRTVLDSQGEKIGKVDELYYDEQGGQPEWALVNTGLFGTKKTIVPIKGASPTGEDLQVSVTKDQVKDAPRIDADQELSEQEERQLFEHYGVPYTTEGSTTAKGAPRAAGGKSTSEDDAMTRSEEELRVETAQPPGAGASDSGTSDPQTKAQTKAQEVAGQAPEKAQAAAGQAQAKLREQLDQRSSQVAEQINEQASDLRSVSEALREQGKDGPAKAADRLAGYAEKVGGYLRDKDSDGLLHDAEDFGRRQPAAVAAGGLVLGFVASRFLKASSSQRYSSRSAGQLAPPCPPVPPRTPPAKGPASTPPAPAPPPSGGVPPVRSGV